MIVGDFQRFVEILEVRVSFSEGPFVVDELHCHLEEYFLLSSNQLVEELIDFALESSGIFLHVRNQYFITLETSIILLKI